MTPRFSPCSFNQVISSGAERCKPTDFERRDARFPDRHPWKLPNADVCLKRMRLNEGGFATCFSGSVNGLAHALGKQISSLA